MVVLRNRCLKLFFSLLYVGKKIHSGYCEDVVQVVGFDWIQLFLQGHLHQVSVSDDAIETKNDAISF